MIPKKRRKEIVYACKPARKGQRFKSRAIQRTLLFIVLSELFQHYKINFSGLKTYSCLL
jgi:hypothetical protein